MPIANLTDEQTRALVGRRFYDLRSMATLSLREVAEVYGTSKQYMQRVESGRIACNAVSLRKLVVMYAAYVEGLTVDWLLGLPAKAPRVRRRRSATCPTPE